MGNTTTRAENPFIGTNTISTIQSIGEELPFIGSYGHGKVMPELKLEESFKPTKSLKFESSSSPAVKKESKIVAQKEDKKRLLIQNAIRQADLLKEYKTTVVKQSKLS